MLIDGYVPIPVFTYLSKTEADDINYFGCPYVNDIDSYYFPRNDTYSEASDYILPVVRDPIAVAYNISDDKKWTMSFIEYYALSDRLLAENMEGDPRRYNFNEEEWYMVRTIQLETLMLAFSLDSSQVYMTK